MANVSSSNSQGELVPKLRFPGFEGEPYRPETVGTLFTHASRRNTEGSNGNVITNSAEHGLIPQRDFFDKDIAVEGNTSNYYLIKKGDFVYNPRKSTTAPYGPFNCYRLEDEGIVSPLYTCLTPKHEEYTEFLLWYFKSPAWYSYIYHNGAQGGARHDRVGMTNELMDGIPVNLPCLQEQEKITAFLSAIDRRIEKQRKLVESLKSYKRGLVQALLTPERNKRDGIEWTSVSIGDLGKFVKGAPLSKADISSDGNPFILYGELYTTYGEVITDIVRKTNAKVDPVYYSKVGDVIIPTSGETPEEISTASCVMLPNVILAGDLNIFRTTLVDGRVLSYILNHIVNWQIARIAQGKSVVHIQASELAQIEIMVPDRKEQSRIISVIGDLDKSVINHEATLKHLTLVKGALLQQLFV